MELLRYNTS